MKNIACEVEPLEDRNITLACEIIEDEDVIFDWGLYHSEDDLVQWAIGERLARSASADNMDFLRLDVLTSGMDDVE